MYNSPRGVYYLYVPYTRRSGGGTRQGAHDRRQQVRLPGRITPYVINVYVRRQPVTRGTRRRRDTRVHYHIIFFCFFFFYRYTLYHSQCIQRIIHFSAYHLYAQLPRSRARGYVYGITIFFRLSLVRIRARKRTHSHS